MNINNRDLVKLAILLSKTVHSLDFPESGKSNGYIEKTLRLLTHLEHKYPDAELLPSIRSAITGISDDKLSFYLVTRDLLYKVNRIERQRLPEHGYLGILLKLRGSLAPMQIAV